MRPLATIPSMRRRTLVALALGALVCACTEPNPNIGASSGSSDNTDTGTDTGTGTNTGGSSGTGTSSDSGSGDGSSGSAGDGDGDGDGDTPPTATAPAIDGDVSPPTVVAAARLALTTEVGDDQGVTGVEFYDGSTLLGAGVDQGGGTWTFQWLVSGETFDGTYSLTARVTDGVNDPVDSDPTTLEIDMPAGGSIVWENDNEGVQGSEIDAYTAGCVAPDGTVLAARRTGEAITLVPDLATLDPATGDRVALWDPSIDEPRELRDLSCAGRILAIGYEDTMGPNVSGYLAEVTGTGTLVGAGPLTRTQGTQEFGTAVAQTDSQGWAALEYETSTPGTDGGALLRLRADGTAESRLDLSDRIRALAPFGDDILGGGCSSDGAPVLVRWDAMGNEVWRAEVAALSGRCINAVAVDPVAGRVVAVGSARTAPTRVEPVGVGDSAFALAYDLDRNSLWTETLNAADIGVTANVVGAIDVEFDPFGDPVVAVFTSLETATYFAEQAVILKLEATTGNEIWSTRLRADGSDPRPRTPLALATDELGHAYVFGNLSESQIRSTAWVAKLNP